MNRSVEYQQVSRVLIGQQSINSRALVGQYIISRLRAPSVKKLDPGHPLYSYNGATIVLGK